MDQGSKGAFASPHGEAHTSTDVHKDQLTSDKVWRVGSQMHTPMYKSPHGKRYTAKEAHTGTPHHPHANAAVHTHTHTSHQGQCFIGCWLVRHCMHHTRQCDDVKCPTREQRVKKGERKHWRVRNRTAFIQGTLEQWLSTCGPGTPGGQKCTQGVCHCLEK